MESYEIIWQTALPQIQLKVAAVNYNFIEPLKAIDLVGNKLILFTNNYMLTNRVNMLREKIIDVLRSQNSGVTDFEIFVGEKVEEYHAKKQTSAYEPSFDTTPIDPKYTFDNFVVGNSNRYLYAAAKAVAEEPGNSYNPLFIYGASGLGKTHIMHAIANYIKRENPTKNVLYATCEKFTNELIASIRAGKAYNNEGGQSFRNRYRNVDVLIIDDVQFLAKKESTQEEFFHTFNELYGANKQIVLSADCDPNEIQLLDERLRTRFDGGLKAQVLPPDIETKIAIVLKKAEERKYILALDVATFIAENSDENVRSLEGMLNKVIFASKLREMPITLELAMDALKESVSQDNCEAVTTTLIIDTVCNFYGVSKADVLSKKRNKEIAEARQVCAYLMTELMSIPLVTVGQALGGRDHATVIHSREKINDLIHVSTKTATEVNDIKNLILKK
ncbi:MAG: chromosomal replication initiator protein DnaA [Clostridia bacterium]|nr:chromosomal replication initiator protein DnaA [Clostridia bacterium]